MKEISDQLWEKIKDLVPEGIRRMDGKGRPWRDKREVLDSVLWILRTGAPGKTCRNAIRLIKPVIEGFRSKSSACRLPASRPIPVNVTSITSHRMMAASELVKASSKLLCP